MTLVRTGNVPLHVNKSEIIRPVGNLAEDICETGILVGLYNPPVQPGLCNIAVEKLGDYLKDCGY